MRKVSILFTLVAMLLLAIPVGADGSVSYSPTYLCGDIAHHNYSSGQIRTFREYGPTKEDGGREPRTGFSVGPIDGRNWVPPTWDDWVEFLDPKTGPAERRSLLGKWVLAPVFSSSLWEKIISQECNPDERDMTDAYAAQNGHDASWNAIVTQFNLTGAQYHFILFVYTDEGADRAIEVASRG